MASTLQQQGSVYLSAFKNRLISKAVNQLLVPNGTVTTLEVKNLLRSTVGELKWNQSDISDFLIRNHASMGLTYGDNGSFRTYSNNAKGKRRSRRGAGTTTNNTGKLTVGLTYQVAIDGVGWKTITPYKYQDGVYRCKVRGNKYRRYADAKIGQFKQV